MSNVFKFKLDNAIKEWKKQSLQEGLNDYIEMVLDAAICNFNRGDKGSAISIVDNIIIILKYTKDKPTIQAWDNNTQIQNYIQTRELYSSAKETIAEIHNRKKSKKDNKNSPIRKVRYY